VSSVKYELGFYIPGDGILHSHRRDNLKYYFLLVISSSLVLFLNILSSIINFI
jgi:hypothetical protein